MKGADKMTTSNPAQSSDATASVNADETVEINRSPEDYAKRLSEVAAENKKFRQANAELKAKNEAIENERLAEQGKWQEIAQKERARAEAAEKAAKETNARFALRTVESQVKAEAAKRGCVDTDALLKLMDMNDLEVDEDYSVKGETMNQVFERMQKEKGYLFSKQAPNHRDLAPGSGKHSFKEKSVKELSLKEKIERLQGKK